jgi:hypothetical protein
LQNEPTAFCGSLARLADRMDPSSGFGCKHRSLDGLPGTGSANPWHAR